MAWIQNGIKGTCEATDAQPHMSSTVCEQPAHACTAANKVEELDDGCMYHSQYDDGILGLR